MSNALLAAIALALALLCVSVAAYYVLPPAGPGTTHVIDPATGQWKRKGWAIVAAPFFLLGQDVVRFGHLPRKRLGK